LGGIFIPSSTGSAGQARHLRQIVGHVRRRQGAQAVVAAQFDDHHRRPPAVEQRRQPLQTAGAGLTAHRSIVNRGAGTL
jgi:hypothetical protein